MPTRRSASRRIAELDALRAIAALNLVAFHYTHVYHVHYGYTEPLGVEWPFGKYGVALFFMLSGMVNAMTLTSKRRPTDFLVSRMIRIAPSYWLMLALNVLVVGVGLAPLAAHWDWSALGANVTMMPGLLGSHCLEPVTWTLQVELLFYGWLLVMFLTGALDRPRRTIGCYLVLALVGCWSVNYLTAHHPDSATTAGLTTVREVLLLETMPLMAIGILVNELVQGRGRRWVNIAGIVAAAVTFHLVDRYDHNPAATALLIGLLVACAYGRVPLLRWRGLTAIGAISYSLYLVHNNLGSVAIWHANQAGLPPWVALTIGLAAALAASWAITQWFERPVSTWLRQRTSWLTAPRKSPTPAVPDLA
jgi:peptidoglycan/LPS O-acetylase OafA/YrhL